MNDKKGASTWILHFLDFILKPLKVYLKHIHII